MFALQIGFIPNQTGHGAGNGVIAACVLGNLLGGSGTVIGAILGAYFHKIDSVLVLLRIPRLG